MMEISLCMIVKNEEEVLGRCLESIKHFVDEMIIVDTGSEDKTKIIASQYDAVIYDFEWCNDFSKARNFAFSKATKDYILWLDADDYITKENLERLLQLKSELTLAVDVVSMHYSLIQNEKGETTYSLRRNRLVKRSLGFLWKGRIHEYLDVFGRTIHSEIYIHHGKDKPHTTRNVAIFRLMEEEGQEFTDRDLFYFGNELYSNGLHEEAIEKYSLFIKRETGWIEDLKTATANIVDCFTMTAQEERKIDFILNSFKWGKPRADLVCRLAEYYMTKADFMNGAFWYKVALRCTPPKDYMGIDMKEYYTFIPSIQLCVCYSNMGIYKKAFYYNELAGIYRPSSPKIEYNRKFLRDQFEKRGEEPPLLESILVEQESLFVI